MVKKEEEVKKLQSKEKEKEEKKISIWQKIKKPLVTGILAAGLMIQPNPAKSLIFYHIRGPPTFASKYIEEKYSEGWKWILLGNNEVMTDWHAKPYFDFAVEYFKKAYKKDKSIDSLYLLTFSLYRQAQSYFSFEQTENEGMKVLKLIEKRLKEQPNDIGFLDLKQNIYYNLGILYGKAATNTLTGNNVNAYVPSKKKFYKEKAFYYFNEWFKVYAEIQEKLEDGKFYAFSVFTSEEEERAVKKNLMDEYLGAKKNIKKMFVLINETANE